MSTDATPYGRHRVDDDGATRRRFTRRGKTLAGVFAALTVTSAILAGTALAAPPPAVPPPSDPEDGPAARAAHAEPVTPGTPCGVSVRACVDLEKQIAWVSFGGKVTRGPMRISSGGDGEATPVGHSLRVYRKEKDHLSGESRLKDGRPAPMPFSVFFQDGGIAFHGGSPDRSSGGCIHLALPDAEWVFNDLKMGDKVAVVNGSVEFNHRHPPKRP